MTRDQLEAHRLRQAMLNEAMAVYHEMEERAYPGAQRLDGMPRSGGNSRKVETLALEMATKLLHLDKLQASVNETRPAVEAYIETLGDPVTRLVVGLRILCALPWKEVAVYCGRDHTEGSVKRRYFKAVDELPET